MVTRSLREEELKEQFKFVQNYTSRLFRKVVQKSFGEEVQGFGYQLWQVIRGLGREGAIIRPLELFVEENAVRVPVEDGTERKVSYSSEGFVELSRSDEEGVEVYSFSSKREWVISRVLIWFGFVPYEEGYSGAEAQDYSQSDADIIY